MPISFCSFMQNGQWSVDTTASSFIRRPFQRSAWWCSCFVRSGVEHTHFAPSNPGLASVSSSVSHRYCGQVSAKTLRPLCRAAATSARAWLAGVAADCPLYIVHLSASKALEQVAAARDLGRNVFAETCPQYLYLSLEDQLAQPGFEGAKWVCSTPLRTKHEHHQADLWKGLRMNELAVVSTDHCPFCFKEQKEMGIGDFSKIPNGIGSVEHRMELIYQGVVTGELTLERWVETCCTTPARMFGMYPRKGIIAPGTDADILVWDPNGHTSIGVNGKHHMDMDHSAWEGFEIDGKVDTVLSRGRVIVEDDTFKGAKGHGQYIRRGLSQYLV